jgi:DivIVA domain-containing protein
MMSIVTTDLFPRVRKQDRGYATEEVEAFLASARTAYATPRGEDAPISAEDIRNTSFSIVRGGYDAREVDAALERLEDAFATRERERALTADEDAWYADARTMAQDVLDRLSRPVGERFERTGVMGQGYHRRDVDRFVHRVVRYLEDGKPLTVEDVRSIVFRSQRGGYRERQVDYLLDCVVTLMLAVRSS